MGKREANISKQIPSQGAPRLVQTILACKWSLTVYQLLERGICRPGEMVHTVDGLSKKVLHDCLNKNVEFGILNRVSFSEVPPRVEYRVTAIGRKLFRVLDEIKQLQLELDEPSGD